jgi:hypothetical protein
VVGVWPTLFCQRLLRSLRPVHTASTAASPAHVNGPLGVGEYGRFPGSGNVRVPVRVGAVSTPEPSTSVLPLYCVATAYAASKHHSSVCWIGSPFAQRRRWDWLVPVCRTRLRGWNGAVFHSGSAFAQVVSYEASTTVSCVTMRTVWSSPTHSVASKCPVHCWWSFIPSIAQPSACPPRPLLFGGEKYAAFHRTMTSPACLAHEEAGLEPATSHFSDEGTPTSTSQGGNGAEVSGAALPPCRCSAN